jgi:hypothetical protein
MSVFVLNAPIRVDRSGDIRRVTEMNHGQGIDS